MELRLPRSLAVTVKLRLANQMLTKGRQVFHLKSVRWSPRFWPFNNTSALPQIHSLHALTNRTSTKSWTMKDVTGISITSIEKAIATINFYILSA